MLQHCSYEQYLTYTINFCLVMFNYVCCLLLYCSSPPAVSLPPSLLCLCDMFVWQPHMVVIETLSLDQMAHLSHTCLPAAAVARAFWGAGESISCWLPHWVAHLFVRAPWPLTPLPPPALTLPVNVTLDSLTAPPPPLFRGHRTHAWLWEERNMERSLHTRSYLK